MARIVAIGGIPGTGKTSIIRALVANEFPPLTHFTKLLVGHSLPTFDLFGKYVDGEVFAGTDLLSMAVQPEAIEFINSHKKNMVFEGDRLFTGSLLKSITGHEVLPLILEVDEDIVKSRYIERGSNQPEKFINSRKTKYQNIADSMTTYRALNNNHIDQENIVRLINLFLETGENLFEKNDNGSLEDFF